MKYKVYGNYVFSKFLGEVEASSQEEAIEKALDDAFSVQVNLKMQGNWMKIPLLPKKLDNKQEAFFVTQ